MHLHTHVHTHAHAHVHTHVPFPHTCRYKAAAVRQIIIEVAYNLHLRQPRSDCMPPMFLHAALQHQGLRVLLRLLQRSLPAACLAELFGCFMNAAADVAGDCDAAAAADDDDDDHDDDDDDDDDDDFDFGIDAYRCVEECAFCHALTPLFP